MTDRELLELIAQKVNCLDLKVNGLNQKIFSMEQNMATKQELRDIRETMATKQDLNRAIAENQKDILAMLQHIEKKIDMHNEQWEDKFEVLNHRLFEQETQLCRIKKQAK
ncbi:MAG: hypothetical protein K6U80_10365 [Firmicutes bacterium]|nr:hypothetical protein [Bacillota bacterium]